MSDRQGEEGGTKGASWAVLGGAILLVAVVVAGVHWPGLSAGALSFDDDQYLVYNDLVQHPSWASARQFLLEVQSPTTVRGYYHPLTMISLMVDYGLGGRPDDLSVFHRVNFSLHIVNTALIVVLMYMLFGQLLPAVLVGVLFGVHPMTVEQVVWVNERKTLLATFFALWCLILYVLHGRKSNWKLLAGAGVMYLLALLSKTTSTPLPVLMLLLDFWPLRRLRWRSVWEKTPFLALMVAFSVITVMSQQRSASAGIPSVEQLGSVALTVCHNIVFYLYKIVWPVDLVSYYPYPTPLALSQPMVLVGVVGTGVMVALLALSLRWTRAFMTGWMLFFVAIFPSIGAISVTIGIAANKFVYLPALGLLVLLTWGLGKMVQWRWGTIVAVVVVALAAGLEAVAARTYLKHWQDTEGLFRYMSTVTPNSAQVRCQLGVELVKRGDHKGAVEHFAAAAQLDSSFAQPRNNLGTMLLREGRAAEAIPHYLEGLRLNPKLWNAHCRLGMAYYQTGQKTKAIASWREALHLRPQYPEARLCLMQALAPQDDPVKAVAYFREKVRENPNWAEPLRALGLSLAQAGRVDEAMVQWRAALKLNPALPDVYFNLGKALEAKGQISAAVAEYEKGLRYKSDTPRIRAQLKAGLARSGREGELPSEEVAGEGGEQ